MSEVNLIALSKPSAITGCHTAEELVAYAARVSNPGNQNNAKTAPKLLKYLIQNEHWSPLEMVHITMEIKTTRDISRQVLRHRSFPFKSLVSAMPCRKTSPRANLGFRTLRTDRTPLRLTTSTLLSSGICFSKM